MKLKFKLSILVISILAVVVAGTAIMLLNEASKISLSLSLRGMEYLAEEQTIYWQAEENSRLSILKTLADIMSEYEQIPADRRREQFDNIIHFTMKSNPAFISLYTIWKPNAVDGMDATFIDRIGSGPAGQYAISYSVETGRVQGGVSSDINDAISFMNSSASNKDRVDEPFFKSINGVNKYLLRMMVTIANPRTKEIVGVVGAILDLSVIEPAVQNVIKNHNDIYAMMVYTNSGFILGHLEPSNVGKNLYDADKMLFGDQIDAALQAVKTGTKYKQNTYSHGLNSQVEIVIDSFKIGTSDTSWSIMILTPDHYIYKDVRKITGRTVLIVIIVILITAGAIFLVLSSVTSHINDVTEHLKEISEGDGDLTHAITILTNDEIGDLSIYFNKTLTNIRNLVSVIKYKVNALTNTGYELSVNMAKTDKAVNDISTNFEEIKGLEEKQNQSSIIVHESLSNIKNNIELQNKLIKDQTASVNTSSSAIEEMTANIHSVTQTLIENGKNVQELAEASEYGRTSLQLVAQKIQEIAKDSEGLLEINSVMNSIAAQTNLLSMNAAIEAAHAGDAGRGFAVVADEIRKLAESSGKQSKTTATVLKQVRSSIEGITKASEEVLARFGAIDSGVKTVSHHELNIRNAMEEQEVGGQQILESISRLREITVSVQNGSEKMSDAGNDLIKETDEFIKVSNNAISSMNEIVSGALTEIKIAVSHVTSMSEENNKNFEDLKSETVKFIVTTGEEKKIILVVDDDANHLTMTKSFLENEYDVITVKSCNEALKLLYQGLSPDYILLDLMMPEVDGWDTYDTMRRISNLHKTPIAIFTSSDDPADMERAKKMGAADYIKKPCRKNELSERIANKLKA